MRTDTAAELRELFQEFTLVQVYKGKIGNDFMFQAFVTKPRDTRWCNLLNGYLQKGTSIG